mmetsp:Transcript_17849/g.54626  ORF Transcript_17849/g.54626 Transcript_17849/m.54626 type:complete len:459 (-) Transcript_17849:99-1475(-)
MNNYVTPLARIAGAIHQGLASEAELALDPVAVPLPEGRGVGTGAGAVGGGKPVVALSANVAYTALVDAEGALYSFGSNIWGQCGVGEDQTLHVWNPTEVVARESAVPLRVREVASGFQHSVALPRDGPGVYTWGKGERGALGRYYMESEGTTPDIVPTLQHELGLRIGAGHAYSAVVTAAAPGGEDSKLWVWGKQQGLQVRKDKKVMGESFRIFEDEKEPRFVDMPPGACPAEAEAGAAGLDAMSWFAASGFHLAWVGQDGAVWMMGMQHPSRVQIQSPVRALPAGARLPGAAAALGWIRHNETGAKEPYAGWGDNSAFDDRIVAVKPALRETLLLTEQGNAWALRFADGVSELVGDAAAEAAARGLREGEAGHGDVAVASLIEERALFPRYFGSRPADADGDADARSGVAGQVRPLHESFYTRLRGDRNEVVRWVDGRVLDVVGGFKHTIIRVEESA